jgi:hypothetical protein
LLKQRKILARYYGEAIATTVLLLNRAPTKELSGKMSYEAWIGNKPYVFFLRTFGYLAYAKIMKFSVTKLNKQRRPLVFIAYASETKGYWLLDPVTSKVIMSRDIT